MPESSLLTPQRNRKQAEPTHRAKAFSPKGGFGRSRAAEPLDPAPPVPPKPLPASWDSSRAVPKSSRDINALPGRQMWERQKTSRCSERPGKHQANTTRRVGSLPAARLFQSPSRSGVCGDPVAGRNSARLRPASPRTPSPAPGSVCGENRVPPPGEPPSWVRAFRQVVLPRDAEGDGRTSS